MTEQTFQPGQKVTYTRTGERGIVKAVSESNPGLIFVVFACGQDWANYHKYTGAACKASSLSTGWDEAKKKSE